MFYDNTMEVQQQRYEPRKCSENMSFTWKQCVNNSTEQSLPHCKEANVFTGAFILCAVLLLRLYNFKDKLQKLQDWGHNVGHSLKWITHWNCAYIILIKFEMQPNPKRAQDNKT